MRLIDADIFASELDFADADVYEEFPDNYCEFGFSRENIRKLLRDAPTVDSVPVVRCRECKHWKPSGSKAGNSFSDMEYIGGCEFTKYCRRESDFCSYGEKEGADNEP